MNVEPDMTRAMKTFLKVPRYGNAVGRIMVHEATLLNWQRVERLLESEFVEAVSVLLETEYGHYLEGAATARDIEEGLLGFLADQYQILDSICAGTFVPEFMRLKYDFHNLKVLLKQRYGQASDEEIFSFLGSIDIQRMRDSFERAHAGNLPQYWEKTIAELKEATGVVGNPQEVDSRTDRLYLEKRLETAKSEKSRFLIDFTRASIDVANIKVLLRGRELGKRKSFYDQALARGGRLNRGELSSLAFEQQSKVATRLLASRYGRMLEGVLSSEGGKVRLTSLDRDSDGYLLDKIAAMRRIAVGPERIIKYMLTRENEVALLRIAFMAKLHGISPGVIEQRVEPAFPKRGA